MHGVKSSEINVSKKQLIEETMNFFEKVLEKHLSKINFANILTAVKSIWFKSITFQGYEKMKRKLHHFLK